MVDEILELEDNNKVINHLNFIYEIYLDDFLLNNDF